MTITTEQRLHEEYKRLVYDKYAGKGITDEQIDAAYSEWCKEVAR